MHDVYIENKMKLNKLLTLTLHEGDLIQELSRNGKIKDMARASAA